MKIVDDNFIEETSGEPSKKQSKSEVKNIINF